jgi:glycine/sarcosine N-methyltransferase
MHLFAILSFMQRVPRPMIDPIKTFYDSMADYYHLIFEDWDQSIHRQARILNSVLLPKTADSHMRILDCACGIGTQSLGLAALGHHVVGSDLSAAAISRAKREARKRGLEIEFQVSDMTDLTQVTKGEFDVVAAFDNVLPHLNSEQLTRAIAAMAAKLRPGGLIAASIRDYDMLLQERPVMQEPSFFGNEGARRIVHQIWDWTTEAKYTVHLYITIQTNDEWKAHHFVSEYHCIKRQELSEALLAGGFQEPYWLMPIESGYYQPLVLARWP